VQKTEQIYVACNFVFEILIEYTVLECPLDDGDNKNIVKKSFAVEPCGFCGTQEQKRSKFKVKRLKVNKV